MLEVVDEIVDEEVATRENSKGSNEKGAARGEKLKSVKNFAPKLPLLSLAVFLFGLFSYLFTAPRVFNGQSDAVCEEFILLFWTSL